MSKRILVVDDEPNIVMSLEFLMKREGFEVEVARNQMTSPVWMVIASSGTSVIARPKRSTSYTSEDLPCRN